MGLPDPVVTMVPSPTALPSIAGIAAEAPAAAAVSLTTILILLCAVLIIAVFIAVIAGARPAKAPAAAGYPPQMQPARRVWPVVVSCVGILLAAGVIAAALLGDPFIAGGGSETGGEAQGGAALPGFGAQAQNPLVQPADAQQAPGISRPPGMSDELYDELLKHLNDVLFYSNEYCGTHYDAADLQYRDFEDASDRIDELLDDETNGTGVQILLYKIDEVYISLMLHDAAGTSRPSGYMVESIAGAIEQFDGFFGTSYADEAQDLTLASDDAASPVQGDYLSGKVFSEPGTQSGGMYQYGMALYFENGRVYVGIEGDSAGGIKAGSSGMTPYELSYTIDGNVVTIYGGSEPAEYLYSSAGETLTRGSQVLSRQPGLE